MKIGKIRISKTWIVVIITVFLLIGYFVVKQILKNPVDAYATEKISKGEVLQEVSETGSVKSTEDLNLSLKTIGRISKINVVVGSDVKKGDVLVELDSSQILAQLQSAKAALSASKTQYEKLLNGSTTEDVKTYQDAVDSANHDLQSTYDSALNVLDDGYNKIYNAYNVVVFMYRNYFNVADQQSARVTEGKNDIYSNMQNIKTYVDNADTNKTQEDIDSAISHMTLALDNIYNDLKIIRDQCEEGIYYANVAVADKTSLDTQKANINTASTSVASLQQSISSYKIALQKAKDNLTFKTANPRSEDIDIYKSQIEQAEATVNLYQSQLSDNYIYSPINGKVTGVNAKRGEIVSPSESIINLLSSEPFQIKVDIYEQDIVNVKIGNPVKINLVAFPKETFEGKVLSIDPAEKIIDNVVYYRVTIDFPNQPIEVRSGMTADIVIETSRKDNVLRISKNAVENIDNKEIVQVVNKRKIESREIVIGLEGGDYYEVVSGLNEGDEIVTAEK